MDAKPQVSEHAVASHTFYFGNEWRTRWAEGFASTSKSDLTFILHCEQLDCFAA